MVYVLGMQINYTRNHGSHRFLWIIGLTGIVFIICYHNPFASSSQNGVNVHIDARTIEHFRLKAVDRKKKSEGKGFEFHNILAEEAFCPNLFRVGRVGDGGKWICGPQFIADWTHKCVIYSFGIHKDSSFETEIHNITKGKCDMIAVDSKRFEESAIQLQAIGVPYVETRIDKTTTNSTTTVTDLMKTLGHTHIDILKMDIEGSEYPTAKEILDLKICQMMVELHTKVGELDKFFVWLKQASEAGYYLIHHESNIKHLDCVEVTLLHSDCFERFGPIVPLTRFLS